VNVAKALAELRQVGLVETFGGNLKLKFPEERRAALHSAIEALRSHKAEAIAVLAHERAQRCDVQCESSARGTLESVLSGHAVELWSISSGRLFLVAGEQDARELIARHGVLRGEIYTAAEARRIVRVGAPDVVAEIHAWKRRFDGVLGGIRAKFG
jgi:hypothetical protein